MSLLTEFLSVKDSDRTGKQLYAHIACITTNNLGSRVINTRVDGSIRIWKAMSAGLADPVIIDNAHLGTPLSISWLPTTDTTFASAGGDSVVKLWKGNGVLEREISVGAKCKIVLFLCDGLVMLAASTEGVIYAYDVLDNYSRIMSVNVWESDVRNSEKATGLDADLITDIKWTNRGHLCFIVGLSNGPVLVFNYEKRQLSLIHSLLGCRSVTCLLVDEKGRYIAAGTKEGVVSFWRTSDMVNCRALTSIDQEISSLAGSRDDLLICVGYSGGSNSRIFESDTLKEVYEIPNTVAGRDGKLCVAWSTRNMFFYSQDMGRVLGYARKDERTIKNMKSRR